MSLALDLDRGELERLLEQHRAELIRYCRSKLRSAVDAEDAVQETLVRAWRAFDRFEGRSSLRSWLYTIANNVCVDLLRARDRWRCSLEVAATDPDAGEPEMDPQEAILARDRLREAFVAALLHLPPRQRTALILCEGLRWSAAEVAELLSTTVASINSALQRARATLAASAGMAEDRVRRLPPDDRRLVAGFVDAFDRYDLDELLALLRPA